MLSITIPGLAGIYLLVHFIENVDEFINAGTGTLKITEYFLLLLPGLIYETAPLAVLLAALLSTMLVTKNMEMLALRSSGISPRTIAKPFFITAAVLSLLLLFLDAFVIPQAKGRAGAIRSSAVNDSLSGGTLIGTKLFYRGPHSILKAEIITADAKKLKQVHWYFFRKNYGLQEMIAASRADFIKGKWHFSQVVITKGGEKVRASFSDHVERRLPILPEDFVAVKKPAEEMDIPMLVAAVHHLRKAGLPCGEQETMLWGQLLYPFLSILLLMVGLPLTISRIRGGLSLNLGLGMAIGLAAWVLWNLAMILGKSGAVPGFAAPLTVEAGIAATGMYILKKNGFTD